MQAPEYWIEKYQLSPHPEGGYFRETHRDTRVLNDIKGFKGPRNASTAIYFLLKAGQISRLHRIQSDEVWHFHTGTRLAVHILNEKGYQLMHLGPDDNFQGVVPAGSWFGAEPLPSTSAPELPVYALVGCTVAPGFDFEDFEFAKSDYLKKHFGELPPALLALI